MKLCSFECPNSECIMQRAADEYARACELHPFFATDLCQGLTAMAWKRLAEELDRRLKEQTRAHDAGEEAYAPASWVLEKQLADMYAAWLLGDIERARRRAACAMAVIMRMDEMMEEQDEGTEE